MTGTNIIPLAFEGQSVRVTDQEGNPWFVAADVCAALGIRNSRDAVARLEDDERADVALTDTSSNGVVQSRLTTVLSEAGVYTVALRCRDAMTPGTTPYKFRKWVTGVALPALRREHDTGIVHGVDRNTMNAIGGMVKGILAKQLQDVVPALIREEVMSGRYSVIQGVSALEVVELAGYVAGRRPRGASQFVTRRLGRFHEDRAIPVRRSRHGSGQVRLFDESAARQWLKVGGQAEIDHYIAQRKGQGKLTLIR